jgi:stalled ribosome alternative rescue factor ArfA
VAKRQTGREVTAKNPVKRRSAAAAALGSPIYRKRVVKSAKAYRRKTKTPAREGDDEQNG